VLFGSSPSSSGDIRGTESPDRVVEPRYHAIEECLRSGRYRGRLMDADREASCDVVYLVLSHTQPAQVVRLVDRLLAGNANAHVVVHHDYARSALDVAAFDARGVDVLRHTQAIRWGTADQLLAILRSLQWVDAHLEYRWLVFISGQDYPLRPPVEIQEFLLSSDVDAFIEKPRRITYRFHNDGGGRDFWSARYFYAYYPLPKLARILPARWAKAVRNAEVLLRSYQPLVFFWMLPRGANTMIGFRRARDPFGDDFVCYAGSDSFTWSRTTVRAVLDFARRRPDALRYYRRTIHPSESFFNSIVMSTPSLRVHEDNFRFDRFADPGTGHPDILRLGDLETLVASGNHFARKFDVSVDDEILNALDREIDAAITRARS
jgi:hypothetical protein